MKTSLLAATLGFWMAIPLPAETVDPFTEAPAEPQVRVQVEFIELSHQDLTDLMFGEKMTASDNELRKQLTQLIKDKKASVRETLLCTTRNGDKATTESVEEIIYPTEYDPAEIATPASGEKKKDPTPAIIALDALGPLPTAFETRNVGPTLEIEPTVSEDGKWIDLRFVAEIVEYSGNTIWVEWKGKHGNTPIQMPDFYTMRINTSVILAKGQATLIGVLSPKDKNGAIDPSRKLMAFVKADIVAPGK